MKKTLIIVISIAVFVLMMITLMIVRMQKPIDNEKLLAPGVTDEPTFHTTSGLKHFFENIDIASILITLEEKNNSDSIEIKDKSMYKTISELFSKEEFKKIEDDTEIGVPSIIINLYYSENDNSSIDCITITDHCVQTLNDDRFTCDNMQKIYNSLLEVMKKYKR